WAVGAAPPRREAKAAGLRDWAPTCAPPPQVTNWLSPGCNEATVAAVAITLLHLIDAITSLGACKRPVHRPPSPGTAGRGLGLVARWAGGRTAMGETATAPRGRYWQPRPPHAEGSAFRAERYAPSAEHTRAWVIGLAWLADPQAQLGDVPGVDGEVAVLRWRQSGRDHYLLLEPGVWVRLGDALGGAALTAVPDESFRQAYEEAPRP